MNTLEIQRRLAALGLDPGPQDGVRGPRTIAAIKAIQFAHGLYVDGIVGPRTASVLLTDPGDPPKVFAPGQLTLPWMELLTSLKQQGIDERGDTEEIGDWASDLGIGHFDARKIPWCGLTVGHIMAATLPDEPLPANVLGARNWQRFGVPCTPQFGAVLVFWRTSKERSFNGHVGTYAAERADAFLVRGGNQGDAVSDAWVSKARLLAARWPRTAQSLMSGKAVHAEGDGALSTNEA